MKRWCALLLILVLMISCSHALADDWTCPSCGNAASGNFCNNCGSAKPSDDWICTACGNAASGNFCNNCGAAYSANATASTIEISHIDFEKEEDFEAALNRGEDTVGKVVCFKVRSVHPDSIAGYNLWSGKHLNFISLRRVDPVAGDLVVAKITDVYSSMGSWFISYEILGINVNLPAGSTAEPTIVPTATPKATAELTPEPTLKPTPETTATLEPTAAPAATPAIPETPAATAVPGYESAEALSLLANASSHVPISISPSIDKHTYFIQDYVGLNLSSIGYTSIGGDRFDRYGSALLKIYPVTLDGTYVDIEDEDELSQYVVVGQNIAPDSEMKLVYQKDSKGKEYSNLIEYQSIESIDLLVVKLDGTTNGRSFAYTPVAINPVPDRYTCYVNNYVGKNLATVGYTSMGGDRMDEYLAARIELSIVTADGTYVDIEDADLLQQYVIIGQSVAPNTEIKLIYQKDSKGQEYDNLIEFCSIGIIDLQVVRVDGAMYNDPAPYEPIMINTSENKYSWYIRNYVGKNLASVGYTSLAGKRMDKYGDAAVELVLVTPDRSKLDLDDPDAIASYVVVAQDVAPNSKMTVTYLKDSKGKEYSNLVDQMTCKKITLTLKKINLIPEEKPIPIAPSESLPVTTAAPVQTRFEGKVQTSRNFMYIVQSDDTAVIVGYTGKGNSVSIPSDLDGHDVSGIGPSVFENHSEITNVVMWADPYFISERAFMGCSKLKDISISSDCTSIGDSAFEGCTKLSSAILWGDPNIGNRAFYGCTSLKEISIGNNTETIGESAFEGCTALKSVIIWGGTNIGNRAFYGCTAIKELSIDRDTEYIGDYAFYGCSSLKVVTIWGKDTKVGTEAFGNCPKLTDFTQFSW